ncbi:hypothetical protein WDU94_012602 [Cyamophila willieti]
MFPSSIKFHLVQILLNKMLNVNVERPYFLVLLLAVVFLIPTNYCAGEPMKKSKLVIIGAGAAGIAAATKLVTNGFDNFVLLEAENRIGGRVHTVPFENKSIDFGAQWIHGQKGNPVYEMAKEFSLVEDECPDFFSSISVNSSHSSIDRESSLQLFKLVHEIMDDDEAMSKHNGSLGEYVRDR